MKRPCAVLKYTFSAFVAYAAVQGTAGTIVIYNAIIDNENVGKPPGRRPSSYRPSELAESPAEVRRTCKHLTGGPHRGPNEPRHA